MLAKHVTLAGVGMAVVVGCAIRGPIERNGETDDNPTGPPPTEVTTGMGSVGGGGRTPTSGAGAGSTTGPSVGHTGVTTMGSGGSPATGSGGSPGMGGAGGMTSGVGVGGGGTGVGGSGGTGGNGCYTEGYDPTTSLTDLASGYNGAQWLDTMLVTLSRRYTNGYALMDAMKTDPWLTGSFPQYFDLNSWTGMIESIDTACHEESHGYDFDAALSHPGRHVYYMGENLEVIADKLAFFSRNSILSAVQQGGTVTSSYDNVYLTGTQGSYDFIFLADELNAYINGLACAVAVEDHLPGSGYSYRDGVAAHLYYLQLYLRIARTSHPSLYNQWKADPDWQEFVRYSWARGHYWTDRSAPHPHLGINDAAIWARINLPANLDEIFQFTADDAATVACTP